jgi:PAS domain-containing protein
MLSHFMISAVLLSSVLGGLLSVSWAILIQRRSDRDKAEAMRETSGFAAALQLREIVLANSRQPVVILHADLSRPTSYGDGENLLAAGLAGPQASVLACALDALLQSGISFELSVASTSGGRIFARGLPILGHAVVLLNEIVASNTTVDYRATLDALPIFVWVRGADLRLRWGNAAFLAQVGANTAQQAVNVNAILDRSELDLASAARDGTDIVGARRYMTVVGERRALKMNLTRLPDASIAGSAIDVTEVVRREAHLQDAADASADVLDKLSIAIAIFGADQRLMSNNAHYARMWSFPQDWLDTHPSQSDVLDRLRESRLLPEQRDFAVWKKTNLEQFSDGGQRVEDFWHMPSGRSLRVVSEPHLQGGVLITYEDVSEILELKAANAALAATQKATLDTIEDAVAVFEPDGRLTHSNKPFARLWNLTDAELVSEPHFKTIAERWAQSDGIWDIVSSAIGSENPEQFGEWGYVTRSDGREIHLTPTRLPNGATLVTFRDMTDLVRFESVRRETTHDAA